MSSQASKRCPASTPEQLRLDSAMSAHRFLETGSGLDNHPWPPWRVICQSVDNDRLRARHCELVKS